MRRYEGTNIIKWVFDTKIIERIYIAFSTKRLYYRMKPYRTLKCQRR